MHRLRRFVIGVDAAIFDDGKPFIGENHSLEGEPVVQVHHEITKLGETVLHALRAEDRDVATMAKLFRFEPEDARLSRRNERLPELSFGAAFADRAAMMDAAMVKLNVVPVDQIKRIGFAEQLRVGAATLGLLALALHLEPMQAFGAKLRLGGIVGKR